MKTLPPTSISTKREELAQWLKENPSHPDYSTVWKDYNELNKQTND